MLPIALHASTLFAFKTVDILFGKYQFKRALQSAKLYEIMVSRILLVFVIIFIYQ